MISINLNVIDVIQPISSDKEFLIKKFTEKFAKLIIALNKEENLEKVTKIDEKESNIC